MSETLLRIAAAQYPHSHLRNWQEYRAKITAWVAEAATQGAKLLVFPEYFSIELTSWFGTEVCQSWPHQLEHLQQQRDNFMTLFSELAVAHHVYICAGSYPVPVTEGHYRNRSDFFWPKGYTDYQDKLQITPFEREHEYIHAGSDIKVFTTDYGKVAINICYDSEFPLLARHQVEQGAVVILTPSHTSALAGYYRVRIGCQARALENQCYVVHSPLVGYEGVGAAAVYTPPDYGFPSDGILAIGELNSSQWVYADLDLEAIAQVRVDGRVSNYHDWEKQFRYLK